jgi:bacterial/archaeal transporter family protein
MTWLLLSVLLLIFWGVFGLFLKLATNFISAGSAFIWLSLGLLLTAPVFFSHVDFHQPYDVRSVWMGIMAGVASGVGTLTVFVAMRNKGKASVVIMITALYSVVTVILAPLIFSEALTIKEVSGVVLSLAAILLLSK